MRLFPFLLGLALVAPARAQWVQLDGPKPPHAFAFGTAAGTTLLGSNEADQGGVWVSDDDGARWTNAGLRHGGATAFHTDAHGTVWLGAYLDGLFRSDDHGRTWAPAAASLASFFTVEGVASVDDTLYAALTDGAQRSVARSTDAGATWSLLPNAPAFSRARGVWAWPGVVLAGDFRAGLWRSTDRGASWAPVVGIPSANTDVGAVIEHAGTLWAGVTVIGQPAASGLYRSTDAGATWARVPGDLAPVWGVEDLAVRGGVLMAALGRQGFRRSTDGGATWTSAAGLPASYDAEAVLAAPGLLLLGTDAGVFRSDDDGASWAPTGAGAVGAFGAESLLVEGATTWAVFRDFAGSNGLGLYRSVDGGATWERRMSGALAGTGLVYGIVRHRGALYTTASGSPRTVYRSPDDGVSWAPTALTITLQEGLTNVFADGDAALYAASNLALFRSTDEGQTWARFDAVRWSTALARLGDDLYAASYDFGVFRSADDGVTWQSASAGLPAGISGKVNALAVHGPALYAATQGGGIYRYDGAAWAPTALATGFFETLLSVRGVLVAGGYDAEQTRVVRASADGGATWLPFGGTMAEAQVEALAATPTHLLAGGRQFGLWARPLADLPTVVTASPDPDASGLALRVAPSPAMAGAALRFTYRLAQPGPARLAVYDALGRRVSVVFESDAAAGMHEATLGARLAPGVYVARLEAGGAAMAVRFVVTR